MNYHHASFDDPEWIGNNGGGKTSSNSTGDMNNIRIYWYT
jgi:hypothetical protein